MRALLVALALFASVTASAQHCGRASADWFYLSEPPPEYSAASKHVLQAIRDGLDADVLPHDPSCLHVAILDDIHKRSSDLSRGRHSLPTGAVGFHVAKLGADNTVYVAPSEVPLEIVMLHETLHSLSHRFSSEAHRHGHAHIVEGITDFITRELAAHELGYRRGSLHSGYDAYVTFVAALVKQLGKDGPLLLADSYFRDGFDAFERAVDQQLGISLGSAARELEGDDLRAAMAKLRR